MSTDLLLRNSPSVIEDECCRLIESLRFDVRRQFTEILAGPLHNLARQWAFRFHDTCAPWLAFPENVLESMAGVVFYANPWMHARLDDRGEWVEQDNICPTAASLYRLCELDFLLDTFRDDEIDRMMIQTTPIGILSRLSTRVKELPWRR